MIGAERRSARGYRGCHTGQVAGHDVGVSLDDHRLLFLGYLLSREVDAVQDLRLLVDRGFGCVQVLWTVVVIGQLSRTETDDVSTKIANWPYEATAKAVVDPAIALTDQSSGEHLFVGEALVLQMRSQRIP